MFNPEVIASSDETNVYEEGCLSIPEQYAEVTRPKVVDVAWMDRRMATRSRKVLMGSGPPACSMRSTT